MTLYSPDLTPVFSLFQVHWNFEAICTEIEQTLEDFQGDAVFRTTMGERTLTLTGPSIARHVDPDPIPIQTAEPRKGFDGKPIRELTSEHGAARGKFKLVGVSKVPR
jgi:hypothetical protein